MIFLYSEEAGKERIKLRGEEHKYLTKVRRHQVGDRIDLRDPATSETLYSYSIESISPRDLLLTLQNEQKQPLHPLRYFHLAWCVVDPKTVEKTLPSLNEIGVSKISFIYCERSQKNFKIDRKRLERILRASNQQCGRSDFIEFAFYKDLPSFLQEYPDVKVFDFGGSILQESIEITTALIGCEGGFSDQERSMFKQENLFRFDTPMVLRSESAALSVAAKILL